MVMTTELLKPERAASAGTSRVSATISRTSRAMISMRSRVKAIRASKTTIMPMTVSSGLVSMLLFITMSITLHGPNRIWRGFLYGVAGRDKRRLN